MGASRFILGRLRSQVGDGSLLFHVGKRVELVLLEWGQVCWLGGGLRPSLFWGRSWRPSLRVDLVGCWSRLRGGAAGFGLLGARLWCHGSDTLRGDLLLFGRSSLFFGKWEWSQCPEDDGPGSRGRPGVQRVAEGVDALAAGRALMGARALLLLKHELVLVLIEDNG